MNWSQVSRPDQRILFVTGKGGVGKSMVALAMAQKAATQKRVLLVELGMRSFYSDLFGIPISYIPQKYKNLDIALWSGTECLKEYALHLLKVEALYKLFFDNKVSRTLIDVAPALSELSILGKITSGVRGVGPKLDYDLIVVDCYATGHMMALLRAPRGLNESIRFGPMAEQTKSMLETIRNPQICSYVIVTLPEELPAVEADELFRDMEQEVGVKPQLYCNKVWPINDIGTLRAEKKKPNSTATNSQISSESLIQGAHVTEDQFIQNVEDMVQRQQAWIHYLRHRHPKLLELPMVFSSETEEILKALKEFIP